MVDWFDSGSSATSSSSASPSYRNEWMNGPLVPYLDEILFRLRTITQMTRFTLQWLWHNGTMIIFFTLKRVASYIKKIKMQSVKEMKGNTHRRKRKRERNTAMNVGGAGSPVLVALLLLTVSTRVKASNRQQRQSAPWHLSATEQAYFCSAVS